MKKACFVIHKAEKFIKDLNSLIGIKSKLKSALFILIINLLSARIENIYRTVPFRRSKSKLVVIGIHDTVTVEVISALLGKIRELVKRPFSVSYKLIRIVVTKLVKNSLVEKYTHCIAQTVYGYVAVKHI